MRPGRQQWRSGRTFLRLYLEDTNSMKLPTSVRFAICATLAFVIALGCGCSEARLQAGQPDDEEAIDNLLRIQGEYCTEPSGDVTFPVKVIFVVDQSNSLQCLDSENRRFEALQAAVNDIRNIPSAEFAFIGFSSWVREQGFTRDTDDIQEFLDPAQGLGPATDYQGVLATTARMLEEDMRDTDPRELSRTRYIVNFVSDGVPEPVCTAGCDSSEPPDSLYGVCNTELDIPDGEYVEHTPCQPYNQPEQILARVDELMELGELYDVGRLNLNTTLLFSPVDVVQQICGDVAEAFGYEREQASGLLRQMANAGEGIFQDVNLEQGDSDYLRINVSSIPAQYGLASMIAHNENAVRTEQGLEPDSDGDGLPDALERELGTDPYDRDTDGDGYSDFFEWHFRNEGFDPLDSDLPALNCRDASDRTGDGLAVCEEDFLGTDPTTPDTSGDGIPDRLKFILGTDPLAIDGDQDGDFDGISNFDEIRGGTHPQIPDEETYRAERILYDIRDRGLGQVQRLNSSSTDERRCYDYDIQRIPMAPTSLPRERGRNRVKLYAQDRLTEMGGVGGTYKVACFEAIYDGESKFPADGVLDIRPKRLNAEADEYYRRLETLAECGYFEFEEEDSLPDRDEIEEMVDQCMPSRITLDNRLFTPDEIFDLMDRHIDSSARLRLPELSYGFFVPMGSFNASRHCHRPWERQRLELLFDDLAEACEVCEPPVDDDE